MKDDLIIFYIGGNITSMINRNNALLSLFISMLIVCAATGCSGSESTDEVANADSGTGTMGEATTASGCCFTKDSDFEPFFPKGNALVYPKDEKPATSFFCGDTDDPKKSSATLTYQVDTAQYGLEMKAKTISIRIEDHTGNQADAQAKIARKTASSLEGSKNNTNVEFKELNSDGLYTGYSWVDSTKGNNSSNIIIEVLVDGRFWIQIMGVDHTRMDLCMQLLGAIPMKDLAAKCK